MTAAIVALMIVVLVAMTGFAVDVGMVFNERRQAQSAADTGVLSAAYELLAKGSSDTVAFGEVVRITHQNLDAPPPEATWRQAFLDCTDPGKLANGLRVAGHGEIDCISYSDEIPPRLRVKLPQIEVDQAFSQVIGFGGFETTAAAEVNFDAGSPNILPAFLASPGSGSGLVCVVKGTPGQSADDCGSDTGNHGYLSITRITLDDQQRCNGGHWRVIASNVAQGIDHFLSERSGTYTSTPPPAPVAYTDDPVLESCATFAQLPNQLPVEPGNGVSDGFDVGLITGGSDVFDDGQPARLRRGDRTKAAVDVRGTTYQLDDTGLWDYIGDEVGTAGSDTPSECARSTVTEDGPFGHGRNMAFCLALYDSGSYTDPIFTRDADGDGEWDIRQSPRFTWLPEVWEDSNDPLGGNSAVANIRQFRPVFIHGTIYNRNANETYVYRPQAGVWRVNPAQLWALDDPAEGSNPPPGTQVSGIPSTGTSFQGLTVFHLNLDTLPDQVIDEGPLHHDEFLVLSR